MKKQIVINASKDRSRIAIVEDGELVELYVENPDNVRTIGNIYLGRVQKVMPAIRAAFVDVGQKQDCFLHFSDLTDNFPQLLAMAGEEVPGLDEPVLSLAPTKRIADDETEPDPEETLEVESGDDESRSRRTRGRRSRGRGRGRRSGGGRREEEEEQEEGRRLPHVIDLTAPRAKPAPTKTDDEVPTDEASDEAEAPPKKRRTRSKKAEETAEPDAEATDAEATEADEAPSKRPSRRKKAADEDADQDAEDARAGESDDEAGEAPKKRRRRRSRRSKSTGDTPAATDDAPSDEEPQKADEEADKPKTRSRRKTKAAPDASDAAGDDDRQAEVAEEPASEPKKKRLPSSIDLTSGGGRSKPRSTEESDDDAADEESARGGRSRRRTRSAETDTSAEADASETDESPETDDDAKTSRRGRRSSSSDESGGRRGRRGSKQTDENADDETDSDQTSSRRRSRGDSSKSDSSNGSRRSSKDEASGQTDGSSRGGSKGRSSGGSIPPNEQLLRRDGRVIVKITKEPISTKGPRVSTDLSLAGRFLVLVPAADYVAVSKKIESAKERRRLRTLASSLKPDGFGVIVRTVAEGRDAKSLDQDLRLLTDKWRKIESKLAEKPSPPVLLYEDVNMVSSVIRDLFSDDYDRILVDDPKVFRNVQAYVKAVAPQMADKVELHKGRTTAFRSVGIESQVEEAFSKRVNMKSGGYLFIETTEAMHVVDVNSGRAGRGKSQKQNLIDVNVEAAKEVAKQLRLRDLGGIIVVDFIDLKYDRDRKKVTDALKEAFQKDRAVTKLLPMSDFGLVQITRQRLRPSITTQVQDEDGEPLRGADLARAAGAAEIRSAGRRPEPEPEEYEDDLVAAEEPADDRPEAPERRAPAPGEATPEAITARLRAWLDRYRREVDERYKGRPIVIRVHPLLGAYLRRGFPSPLTRWRLALRGVPFRVEEDPEVDPLAFDVRDQKSGRPLLKKYAA